MTVMVPVEMCAECGKKADNSFLPDASGDMTTFCRELGRRVKAVTIDPYCPYRVKYAE